MNRLIPLFSFCILHFAFCISARAQTPIADPHTTSAHVFTYHPAAGENPKHVNLAGDFNGWSTTATEMAKTGDDFTASPAIPDGVHHYKFVVDGKWTNDPASDKSLEVSDDNGGTNSAVMVGPDGRKLPPPVADKINVSAVMFDPTNVADCNVVDAHTIRLAIRTQAGDVSEVNAIYGDGREDTSVPLFKIRSAMGFDYFGAAFNLYPTWRNRNEAEFRFELKKPGMTVTIAKGLAYEHYGLGEMKDRIEYDVPLAPTFATPDWAKHAIWYQIFPERFRNGDTANDPDNTQKWTSDWYAKHPGETGNFYGKDVWARRYGGDIQGIRQELPYLKNLGINAIYLNPIFEAADLHKYDTSDYRHVDQHFGFKGDIDQLKGETDDPATWQWTKTDKLFLDFLADAHKQGFHVIIDGVFNHTGKRFWAFQDVVKNGKDSKYADWFNVTSWDPFHYRAWDGDDGWLPELKKDPKMGFSPGPRAHLFAITKRWLAPDGDPSRGVDGFRLDAPEGIPHPFWIDWRKLVKQTKPDAYIDGEIWGQAQAWLAGDQYDAVMNYQFAMLSQSFFVNNAKAIPPSQFAQRAMEMQFAYPFQAVLDNQNLFDSHDTDRVASMFVNPDLPYDGADRIQDNGPHYNPRKPNQTERARMLQEVAWQMTYVGAPMIYYGDEAGMWSADDPSDRQPMVWKDLQPYDNPEVSFDQEKFDWYQKLIAIRHHFPALQTGFFHPVLIDDKLGIVAYARTLDTETVVVVLNHTDHEQTIDVPMQGKSFVDWIRDSNLSSSGSPPEVMQFVDHPASLVKDGKATVKLPAWGVAILPAS
jgi:cyclomaltodextrinase